MSQDLIHKIIRFNTTENMRLIETPCSIYTFLNPVSYLTALKHESLFMKFNGILIDGYILAVAIRLLYGVKIKRCSFDMTSIAASLFQHALVGKKTVYLIGAKSGQIELAVEILRKQYPEIRIAGYRDGYFSSTDEMRNVCEYVTDRNPDFVIVGMGTPLQEQFLLSLRDTGYRGIGFTCGGFFTQLSMKGTEYYPLWIDRCNLRFLYRFYKEKHTRKRYLKTVFLFPLYFIWNKLK